MRETVLSEPAPDNPQPEPDIRIISQAESVSGPDDPSFPYRLDVRLRPPPFQTIGCLMGSQGSSGTVVVRGRTKEAVDAFIGEHDFRKHPRLRRLTVTGPEGTVEEIET